MTVKEAQGRIGSREFETWRAWLNLPSGPRLIESMLARLTAILYSAHAAEPKAAADFMPSEDRRRRAQVFREEIREASSDTPATPHWQEVRRKLHRIMGHKDRS